MVGAHNIKQSESSQQERPVTKWTNHEHYHSGNIQNDIALVEHGIFYENSRVRPIQLPVHQNDEWLHEGDRMRVCGWGTVVYPNLVYPDTLNCADVSFIPYATCNDRHHYNGMIKHGMMCAGVPETGGKVLSGLRINFLN